MTIRLSLIAALAALVCAFLTVTATTRPASAGSRAPQTIDAPQAVDASFVGSETCGTCHVDVYTRWRDTLMANILVDPAERPEWVLGDFSTPDPLVSFTLDDVAFTYGSKWKQRYFTRVGDDYFALPAQWDVQNRTWRRYYVEPGTEWWTEHYGPDPMDRPTGPLCDGCHSTNYNVETKEPTEWNVGCEKCHGPGGNHVQAPSPANIVNPARLDPVRAVDVCIQCHSQGQPPANPIDGVYYDWPVGFLPGERLSEYWRLEEHHLGEETPTHFPEGSAHKNRMQGNDFVTSAMYANNVTCWSCHDVHGTENNADLIKPANAVCLTCHGPLSPSGPSGTVAEHTNHAPSSEGGQCVACHMPQIARTIADVNVRSHTFRFITPTMSEQYGIPNPCTSCHTDETNEWAREALLQWPSVSPWRVAQ